jgi:threonyl-tRNA synthetase
VARIAVRSSDATTEVEAGTTAVVALKALEAIRGQIVAAEVDGAEWDLDRALPDTGEIVDVVPIYADTEQGRAILRHSVAHLMAQAVTDLYPGAKWAIGPPVENGFYYDFDVERPFTPDDLEKIEARMKQLMKERQTFERVEVTKAEALAMFADQPYKTEVVERVSTGAIGAGDTQDAAEAADGEEPVFTVYRNMRGDDEAWADLCRGPHIPSSERVPAFKLLRTAGAYWRGREDQPMLQRIYGTAWESKNALKAHMTMLEEAAKRDHRKLGRELELTHFPPELGPGLGIFLPKGARVRQQMEDWIRSETMARGYEPVYTPHIAKEDLWQISGHLENYGELMYPGMAVDTDDEGEGGSAYRLKPMNCPFHILAYQSRLRSYRELPVRLAELGTVYRYEKSGVVNGQLRARGFTQDDSHIFCTPEQVVQEVADCVTFAIDVIAAFGLGTPSRIAISTRPEAKSVGTDEGWAMAENALIEAVEGLELAYELDAGEGAFYGPKIDIHAKDAIGREWQLSTVQIDFNLPDRFDVSYIGDDGDAHRPYMVHRALFGSIERFFAVLVESTNGAFPTWLSPTQVNIVPVASEFADYAEQVAATLRDRKVRVDVDHSDDTLGNKIRKSTTGKTPYTLVVGGDEAEANAVMVRPYTGKQRKMVPLDSFVHEVVTEIDEKRVRDTTPDV